MATYKWPLVAGTVQTPDIVDGQDRITSWLMALLATSRGERVMRPSYGIGLWDLTFENVSSGLVAMIRRDFVTAVKQNEPAIDLRSVNVDIEDGNRIVLTVEYGWNAEVRSVSIELAKGVGGA